MVQVAFPLAVPRRTAVLSAGARRRIRTVALPLAVAAMIAMSATTALVQLTAEADRLAGSIGARETANAGLVNDIAAAEHARTIAAIRAADLQPVLAEQRAALDSRDGFLP